MLEIKEKTIQSENGYPLSVLELQNDYIKVSMLPEIGGKIISLASERSGMNYLLDLKRKYLLPTHGDPFDLRYAYGFDECFPTIEPCSYKFSNKIIKLSDHGELWPRPWHYEIKNKSILLTIGGGKLDYSFKKEFKLLGGKLIIKYTLKNNSDFVLDYIWSSHPLLSVQQGDEILLDEEIQKMFINWSSDPGFGALGEYINWPVEYWNQDKTDWSLVQNETINVAAKLFTNRLTKGRAAIYRKRINETLLLQFDTDKVPYLGLWLCYGGWPENRDEASFTVALEPTNAQTDSLAEAIERSEALKIEGDTIQRWEVQYSVVEGKASI